MKKSSSKAAECNQRSLGEQKKDAKQALPDPHSSTAGEATETAADARRHPTAAIPGRNKLTGSQHQKPSRIRQLSEQGLVEAGGAPANAGDLSWEAMAAAASIKQNTDL